MLFTTGCNFICPYCHNADLARGEYPQCIELSQAVNFLQSRQGMLEGVTITGGEPTLHSGIIDLCRSAKSLGYAVKLDTNGSRPEVLHDLIAENLVDYFAMDIKAPLDAYDSFSKDPHIGEKLEKSIRLIMQSPPAYEFRTTCANPFTDYAAIESIANAIKGAQCYALQTFNHRAECLDPAFSRRRDAALSADEMGRLQALAAPLVNRCIIR